MAQSEKTLQIERFRAAARAIGCNDDKEELEATLAKIAAHKPAHKVKKPKATKRKARPSTISLGTAECV